MCRSSWCLGVLLGSTITIGCSTTTPKDSGEEPPAVPTERVVPPTEPAPAPAPAPEPYSPDPAGFGDPCSDDAGCGWDDPCVPTRCIAAASARDAIACEESAPAPGACSCVAGRCSLKPKDAPAESPSCRLEPCGLDQGAGRCVAGSMLDANRQIRDVGPACSCAADSLECRFVWVEPIACETGRCSLLAYGC